MFILKVTKNNQVQQSDFSTRVECEAHFEKYRAEGFWGKEEYSISHEEIPAVEAKAEERDIDGNLLSPAIEAKAAIPSYIEVVPCEYTYEILDNTILDNQESIKKQIAALESQITSRRVREAVLLNDHTFLQDIDNQIISLRAQL